MITPNLGSASPAWAGSSDLGQGGFPAGGFFKIEMKITIENKNFDIRPILKSETLKFAGRRAWDQGGAKGRRGRHG